MQAIILDTETTGKDFPYEPIEIAYIEVDLNLRVLSSFEKRYLPNRNITLGATATHHIFLEELKNCPNVSTFEMPKIEYMIGHNIDFDWVALGKPDCKRIDTLAMARHMYPELDSHTQTALIYYFEGISAKELVSKAHSALADVEICSIILKNILEDLNSVEINILSWADLWNFSEHARIPTIMPFGKHKGEKISGIPVGYKLWLLSQPDLDEYLKKAINLSLGRNV